MSKKTSSFTNGESSIIGLGTIVDGSIKTDSTIRVDGEVNGDLTSKATVIIGEEGKVVGNVTAQEVMISGSVNGNVKADTKLEIIAKGKVAGDIYTKSLSIDESAMFQGKCVMEGMEPESKPVKKATRTKKATKAVVTETEDTTKSESSEENQ